MVGAAARPLLADWPLDKLAEYAAAAGQPEYRGRQVFEWVHRMGVSDPAKMTNLPKAFREMLSEEFDPAPLDLREEVKSADGSIKYAWLTRKGDPVEAVMMPGFEYGTAVCVSSQSGCPMKCKFCQTGYMGLRSWLSAGQILTQLYEAEKLAGMAADRIVFMGMGEPLLNLRAVHQVVDVLTSEAGRAWSPRRVTVSTVGLTARMVKLAREFPPVNLALSLHFTTAGKRREYMPDTDHDIAELATALYFYRRVNGGKVTIEYALMEGVNDGADDARRLVKFARMAGLKKDHPLIHEADEAPDPPRLRPLPVHVNLIEYNPIPSASFRSTPEQGISEFAGRLKDGGVPVTVRRSRGQDVAAACGQLGSGLVEKRAE